MENVSTHCDQASIVLQKSHLCSRSGSSVHFFCQWGCITYRDTMLLIDPDQSSALIKQRAAKTVAHEISHMWFGNLVTVSTRNNPLNLR
jgi:puromycin-sensitive aminopeptidase